VRTTDDSQRTDKPIALPLLRMCAYGVTRAPEGLVLEIYPYSQIKHIEEPGSKAKLNKYINKLHSNENDGASDNSKQQLDGQWLLPSVDTAHTAHAAAVEASTNTEHHRHGQNDSSPSSSTLYTCMNEVFKC
jgi:hypothetical protein